MLLNIKTTNVRIYPIIIGSDLDSKLIKLIKQVKAEKLVIITDEHLAHNQGSKLLKQLKTTKLNVDMIVIPAGETNKTQPQVTKLQHTLLKKHYGRDTLIIALGGGVVGDLAGFVAATYLRGVPYIQVPTTVLAMVDASVGGKVGIDTVYGKNTIGAFYQPVGVIMDMNRLRGLPHTQQVSGLIEALKTFLTSDRAAVKLIINKYKLDKIISRSVKIKSAIVMRDEHESNERRVINFGHTIGHALEKMSKYTLPHGYAVGYGIIAECSIAQALGILSEKENLAIQKILQKFGITKQIFSKYSAREIISVTHSDKKVQAGLVYYILLKKIGQVYKVNGQYAHPVSDKVVFKVLTQLGCKP
ncbi:MAG: 3-dehydroquinate synthase [Patescibacteria group bacterium]|jgi:3-dehydroquinate synthase